MTPGNLLAYVAEAVGGGQGADGLLQRLQATVWPDLPGDWKNVDRWPDSDARREAREIFRLLDQLNAADVGADRGAGEIPVLRFAADAQELFNDWRTGLEQRLRSVEMLATPAYESHIAKYRSLMPTLALLTHLVEVLSGAVTAGPVSLPAARRAAALVDFFDAHARRVYAVELQPGNIEALALAKKIRSGAIRDGNAVRDLYRPQWAGLRTADAVERGLERLAELGWVRLEESPKKNPLGQGRAERVVRLHPSLCGDAP